MSEEIRCPGCHTVRQDKPREGVGYARRYACGTTVNDNNEVLQQGRFCIEKELRSRLALSEQATDLFIRQLAQRDNRLAEREAEVEKLKARIAELERCILEYVRDNLLLMAKN